jgi:hypothetical protein
MGMTMAEDLGDTDEKPPIAREMLCMLFDTTRTGMRSQISM